MKRLEEAREAAMKKMAEILARVRERAEFPMPADEAKRLEAAKIRELLERRYP